MNHYLSRLVHWVNGEGEDPAARPDPVPPAPRPRPDRTRRRPARPPARGVQLAIVLLCCAALAGVLLAAAVCLPAWDGAPVSADDGADGPRRLLPLPQLARLVLGAAAALFAALCAAALICAPDPEPEGAAGRPALTRAARVSAPALLAGLVLTAAEETFPGLSAALPVLLCAAVAAAGAACGLWALLKKGAA